MVINQKSMNKIADKLNSPLELAMMTDIVHEKHFYIKGLEN